jgi:hypothetical protein
MAMENGPFQVEHEDWLTHKVADMFQAEEIGI